MAITYRATKGAALTHNELDGNFADLATRTADGWADVVSEMYIQPGSPSAPTVTEWQDGIFLPEFNHIDTLSVLGRFHVPHTYKRDSMIYPHVHFVTNSTASGVTRWSFKYKWARRHDSTGQTKFTAAQTINLDFTINSNNDDTHFVAELPESGGIPGAGIEPDAMIMILVSREAAHINDTFDDSVWGITIDCHIEADRQSTPFRAPDFYTGA